MSIKLYNNKPVNNSYGKNIKTITTTWLCTLSDPLKVSSTTSHTETQEVVPSNKTPTTSLLKDEVDCPKKLITGETFPPFKKSLTIPWL